MPLLVFKGSGRAARIAARLGEILRAVLPVVAALVTLLFVASAHARVTGQDIARQLIRQSERTGPFVDLRMFGSKVCLVPEGSYASAYVDILFKGFTLAFQESDASEGVWFFLVADAKAKTVKIFAIKQVELTWPIAEDEPLARNVGCPAFLKIEYSKGKPTVFPPRDR